MPVPPHPQWLLPVVGDHAGNTPVVVIIPRDVATHDSALRPLRRDGWVRPSRHEWARGAYTAAPNGFVDVVKHEVVRVGTGQAHLFAVGRPLTTPIWRSAAHERRALVVLVPHDALSEPGCTSDQIGDRLTELVAERAVTAALVTVRFDQFTGPYPPGWNRR